jgi:hypothetical protein
MRKGGLNAARDVAAIDVEHGIHILVTRRPDKHRRGVGRERIAWGGIGRHGGRRIGHSRTT